MERNRQMRVEQSGTSFWGEKIKDVELLDKCQKAGRECSAEKTEAMCSAKENHQPSCQLVLQEKQCSVHQLWPDSLTAFEDLSHRQGARQGKRESLDSAGNDLRFETDVQLRALTLFPMW